jgi:transposase
MISSRAPKQFRISRTASGLWKVIASLVRPVGGKLLEVRGISDVAAAGLIGHSGDLRNLRSASAFAMKSGTAPISCSSGRRNNVRVNLGGDRQLNRLLHIVAMSQVRDKSHAGRVYYERKRSEGKTHLAAMRCLKRILATVLFYRLREVHIELERAPIALSNAA